MAYRGPHYVEGFIPWMSPEQTAHLFVVQSGGSETTVFNGCT
jgi:hypothetical protein